MTVGHARIPHFALVLALLAPSAQAQLSGSVALASDYRFRGLSLSDEQLTPQLALNYDTDSGWYGGTMLARARLRDTRVDALAVSYAGYAGRITSDLSWEGGYAQTALHRGGHYNYGELFAGLAMQRLGARLYYSPRYFGVGGRSLYAEVNASVALASQVDLVGRIGYLRSEVRSGYLQYSQPSHADGRIGINYASGAWSGQLAWVATARDATLYQGGRPLHARALVLSSQYMF